MSNTTAPRSSSPMLSFEAGLWLELLSVELEYRTGTETVSTRLDLTQTAGRQDGLALSFGAGDGGGVGDGGIRPHLSLTYPATNLGPATAALWVRSFSPAPAWGKRLSLVCRVVSPEGALPGEGLAWIRNGWQSWSFCGLLDANLPGFSMPSREFAYRIKEDADIPQEQAPYVSDMIGGVRVGARGVLVGAGPQTHFQTVRYQKVPDGLLLFLETDLDSAPIGPGATLLGGSWEIEGGQSLTELSHRWAVRKGVVRKQTPPLMAWCSWYERGPKISFDYVCQIIEVIKKHAHFQSIGMIQVDDGYQNRVGDWLYPKPSFGADLAMTAEKIHKSGYEAGLWVAPFIAQGHSRLFAEHPDWFLKRGTGFYSAGWNPFWLDTIRALDTSHPEVLKWLFDLFTKLRSYGFSLFKLDYLYPAAIPCRRHDVAVGRFQAFRQALQVIRDAVGPQATLLGCGAPLAPSIGLVDAMRVSVDIDVRWQNPGWLKWATGDTETTGLGPAVRNSLTRGPFCSPLFRVDPDCLLLREKGSALSQEEREVASWLAALHGEWVLLGDDLTKWGNTELARLEQFRTRPCHGAMPLDSLDQMSPQWVLAKRQNADVLAAFNMSPEPKTLELPFSTPIVPQDGWEADGPQSCEVSPQRLRWENVPSHSVRVASRGSVGGTKKGNGINPQGPAKS